MLKSFIPKFIKKIVRSDIFKTSLFTSVIVLFFHPFSVFLGFKMTALLSKPILSIEYVSRYEKDYFNFDELILQLKIVTDNDIYQDHRSKTWLGVNSFDLRILKNIPSLAQPSSLEKKIRDEIEHYENYLDSEIKEVEVEIGKLPTKSTIDMKILAHQFLDSSSILKDDEIMVNLKDYFKNKKIKITNFKGILKNISDNLNNPGKIVDIKLSVLNKGSTDGLIRNRGTIYYGGNKYKILRISPPSSKNVINAVPTFQVNIPQGTYSPQSVGQIIKNTMTDLWFRVEEQKKGNEGNLCSKQGQFTVTLNNQDNKSVEKKFTCLEGG